MRARGAGATGDGGGREGSVQGAYGAAAPASIFGFQVVRRLGSGAGSTIYAVRGGEVGHGADRDAAELYALKHVVRTDDKDIRFIEQLEAEHAVGHGLCHGGLRRTFDLRMSRNLFRRVTEAVLIMEFFPGEPLDARPADGASALAGATGSRRIHVLLAVFVQTARALDALHAAGYVHCDLKPANILVGRTGRVKVIDLGQAARAGTVKPRIQGTPDYIAPEQVRCQPVTPQTDLYNLGATMYAALCGKPLPTLYTLKKEANSFLLDAAMAAPSAVDPAVPEPLSNLVMQCVRTNAAKRPASAAEVAQRLETIHYGLRRRADAAAAPRH